MTKISQLVDIGANLAANDEFLIRDVSEAGTPNKKVTSSGFVDYIVAQGTGAGFTQIAAGVGPLARALASSSGTTGTLTFSTAAATTLIERARIDSGGRLLVGTSTANTSGAKLQTSDGLTFPATQVASADPNTLDDYEEGTFTPIVFGSATFGTATYTGQVGVYTKIGRLVTASFSISYTGGTGAGTLRVSGFPFLSANTTNNYLLGPIAIGSIPAPAGSQVYCQMNPNSAEAWIQSFPLSGGDGSGIPYDGAGDIIGTITYQTA
jgi:hypothetical protein